MRKISLIAILLALVTVSAPASAQSLERLIGGVKKAAQAYKLSDKEVQAYVHEYITKLDSTSKVLPATNAYTKRLAKLTQGLDNVEGIPLNFKVYETDEVNAFACADGSVRVYSGLMDLMDDNEILGVIGHEIGHVAHKDTKEAFKNALLTSALKDGLSATSSKVAMLTDSQIGAIGEKMLSARYSRKQEDKADDYGYEFLVKKGKNPWAMALAFEKLKSLESATPSVSNFVNNLFSDHPDVDKRIKRMAQRATKDGFKTPVAETTTGKKTTTNKSTKR